jgi:glycosyltransferase involved in cell wall biosynthesis
LVEAVEPDIIHSHFVSTTLVLRAALGAAHAIPRVFQVPGPLHLQNGLFRQLDLRLAGPADWWLASSAFTRRLYVDSGIDERRVALSYYGIQPGLHAPKRTGLLRRQLGIPSDALLVGNVSWMYPPKLYLGQRQGLKRHELMIDALARLTRRRSDVYGVLVGGAWGDAHWYERLLHARTGLRRASRVILPGPLPLSDVRDGWADFDCAIHVPSSENCGGVIEPLLAGVPVIAARVGGIPEVVVPGMTGRLLERPDPAELADAIADVLDNLDRERALAAAGGRLVREMFDAARTAKEVHDFYRHILESGNPPPLPYDCAGAASRMRDAVEPT